jgi:molecular chaperone DnaK (HSP70)
MAVEEAKTNGTTPADRHAIGIAFGNSNSSIAYTTIEDKPEVIANEEGGELTASVMCAKPCAYIESDRQIPSVLSYVDGEEFHGTQAKAQLVRNSKNTVAYFRDFLGQEW